MLKILTMKFHFKKEKIMIEKSREDEINEQAEAFSKQNPEGF